MLVHRRQICLPASVDFVNEGFQQNVFVDENENRQKKLERNKRIELKDVKIAHN